MNSIDDVLDSRGTKYGIFANGAKIIQDLKRVIFTAKSRDKFSPDQAEAIELICHKLGRIVNGDHDYSDNWIDIAGYAKLVSDRLDGKPER